MAGANNENENESNAAERDTIKKETHRARPAIELDTPPPAPPPKSPRWRIDPIRIIALAIAALLLFPLLARAGIWDPYELDNAELARRIAVNLWDAPHLRIPDAQSSMPTLTDLQMGELPFTSMALGFKLFGLNDWSGRLPLALWAFAGAAVLYEFLARFIGRKAGLYAAAALVTMPLYFMQARTMLGDIVTMAAVTIAFCGLAGALLSTRPAPAATWAGLGLLGLAAGYLSRGLLLGVAVPALSVGLAWLVLRASDSLARRPHARDLLGAAALLGGATAAALGIRLLLTTAPDAPLPRALGLALLRKATTEATFDLPIRQLGHALFPWSAFLPFAIGRLFRAPVEVEPDAREREITVRVLVIVGASVAFAAAALLGPYVGPIPFPAPALLAAIAAIAIHDFERGAPPSRALALGTLVLAFVLYRDMAVLPDRALSAFVVEKPTFPKSFEDQATSLMRAAAVIFGGLCALAWFEETPSERPATLRQWAQERADAYAKACAELAKVWNGNLVFTAIILEATLIGLGAMIFIGKRAGWSPVERLPLNFAFYGLNAWWALPLLIAPAAPILQAIRDAFRAFTTRTRQPRAAGTILAALLAGGALSLLYYPALAAQLSPKEVFDSYTRLRGQGEPLGLLGVQSRAATYYKGGGEVSSFTDVTRAFEWLTADPNERRWLVVKADDLPRLNSMHRKLAEKNLPVLDGRSSQILLVSSKLAGHPNENWLGDMVLDQPPAPAQPLDAMFEDQLDVLGWEVIDTKGRVQPSVVPQTTYHLRTYYRVRKPVTGSWKAFLHIDGHQRRYNGDHAILEGRYPMNLWQPGDVIVDEHTFQLEPNFTPGDYTVYFGFFAGDVRFRVTRGAHHENRVIAGTLRVR